MEPKLIGLFPSCPCSLAHEKKLGKVLLGHGENVNHRTRFQEEEFHGFGSLSLGL